MSPAYRSSCHTDANKHASSGVISTTDGRRQPLLPRTANGRLVCLFIISCVLRALNTCITLPSGSGATAAHVAADKPTNNEAAHTRLV